MHWNSLNDRATRILGITGLTVMLAASAAGPAAAQAKGERQPAEQGTRREALERRVRERIAQEVQERLGLDDAQTQRLGETNRKFEDRRRVLLAEERTARIELRAQLTRKDSADQRQVGALVDQLISVQRRRLDLVEQEQRELAAFLTPVQRATYLSLQDQMRRRMDEMRRGGGRRPGARGRAAPATP